MLTRSAVRALLPAKRADCKYSAIGEKVVDRQYCSARRLLPPLPRETSGIQTMRQSWERAGVRGLESIPDVTGHKACVARLKFTGSAWDERNANFEPNSIGPIGRMRAHHASGVAPPGPFHRTKLNRLSQAA